MRVLLTNDDGIRAPGIRALFESLIDIRNNHDGPIAETVWPVAPLTVQSATSHGVTFHTPLMVTDERVTDSMIGLAVDGRPADCVKLAITSLWPERFGDASRPDLVISGMNAGANVGINVIYSGTVAAAIEAAFLGVPSIAVSLHIGSGKPDFARAADWARRAIDRVILGGLPAPHACININIPVCESDGGQSGGRGADMPEMVVCPMNAHGLVDAYEKRLSPGGDAYYWATGSGFEFRSADPGTDVPALFERKITVTPLAYDLTAYAQLDFWRDRLSD